MIRWPPAVIGHLTDGVDAVEDVVPEGVQIGRVRHDGAEAVILGCTEIGMLVNQEDTEIRLLNTTEIHAEKAVERAL